MGKIEVDMGRVRFRVARNVALLSIEWGEIKDEHDAFECVRKPLTPTLSPLGRGEGDGPSRDQAFDHALSCAKLRSFALARRHEKADFMRPLKMRKGVGNSVFQRLSATSARLAQW